MVSVPPKSAFRRSKNVDKEVLFQTKVAHGANRILLMSQQIDLCPRHSEVCLTQASILSLKYVTRTCKFVDNNYIRDLYGQD